MDPVRAQSVLTRSLEAGSLSHALLLYGGDLQQIEEVAVGLARGMLKTHSDPLQHPDCFALRPANKMRRISVDSTRDLIRSIQQTSNQGGAKVALIYDADRMATESANAFLKTLEEPPIGTTLILLTTRLNSILPTIRSRCLSFRINTAMKPIEDAEWGEWLSDYDLWLKQLQTTNRSKESIPTLLFSAYALAARLESLLSLLADRYWKIEKDKLPDTLEDVELEALEAGTRKSIRSRIFREIETTTHDFAIDNHTTANGLASRLLPQVVQRLESLVGLFEANINENTAIENFFLYSLRTWRI